ncbi:MAG: type II toxin-antitoxin system VapC family toxin [Nitrospirota bacterium]
MNGNRFLIDTNILLYLTGGKIDSSVLPEGEFYISFITELEVLSYSSITTAEENQLKQFLLEIPVIDITKEIKNQTIAFRKKYHLKLPDAIICATAFQIGATLITNDKSLLSLEEVKMQTINVD